MRKGGRHEINQGGHALVGDKGGFQDHGSIVVMALDVAYGAGGRDLPSAVLWRAQHGGETRRSVKPWKAEPVDGPQFGHKCRCTAVSEQGVIFYSGCHKPP